ncbi:MAG: hypothetical protein SW019_18300 [Actinomycetota bacterium]|nr:hypothetical protein [Actinomycetota bacterium]
MAKDIDRQRAQGALAVVKQHPGMVLFALSPVLIALGLVWWLLGAGWALLLGLVAVVGGGAAVVLKRR